MKLSRKDRATLARMLSAETTDFRELVTLIGLNTGTALRGADLRGIDFGTTDLSGLDLTMADVSGSDLSRTTGLDPAMPLVTDATTRLPPRVERLPFEPEMVLIPAGSFRMGATKTENERYGFDETENMPKHLVTFATPFWIGKYPVTRGEYAAFVSDSGYAVSNGWRDPGFPQTDHHPVVSVSAEEADAYVAWLSARTGRAYRLPSEAEWEYAARAGTTTVRYWGNGWDRAGRFAHVDDEGTAPVGTYQPNSFGLHDMLGNVWEWIADCWNHNYSGAPTDGSAWIAGDCSFRSLRGGSWGDGPGGVRAAFRNGAGTDYGSTEAGFRVART
jgi:formylglycine-generating enzyme required for sulfatase activity